MDVTNFMSFVSALIHGLRPQRVIKEASRYAANKTENANVVEGEMCCVCLSILMVGENIRVLPCLHRFHGPCVGRWFEVCRKTCLVCRLWMGEKERFLEREELTEEMVTWFSSFHAAGF